MVSNQVVTGVNIWSLAVMMLGPAAITGAVSIIISQLQLKMKISEIKGESEYKARENLFQSYQRRLTAHGESSKEFFEGIGKTFGYYVAQENEQEGIKMLKAHFKLIKLVKDEIPESIDELERELRENKLFTEDIEKQISFMKKTISVDLEKIAEKDMGAIFIDYCKVIDLLHSFENTLLEKKRDELFSKYLT